MRVLLLQNERSGTRGRRATVERLQRELEASGHDLELRSPGSAGEMRSAAAAARRSDHDVLVAAGGDGTLGVVANGLVQTPIDDRPALAILPTGRGNDFAAAIGVRGPRHTVESIVSGEPRRIDVGRTEAGVFLGVAGAGFDAQTARRARQTPVLAGGLLYSYAVMRTLFDFRHLEATVRYEGGAYDGPVTFAAVGNSPRYGGGMHITPRADLEDGLLDLCLVKDVSAATLLYMFPTVFRGSHLSHPRVHYVQTPFVSIETSEPAEVYADGEPLQQTPAHVEAVRGALEVLMPRTRSPRAR